ncbi:hypothetical protein OJAV_G00049640 [Oryzias javanicus]|uniref:Protein HGH1 homolog n=1 Tax=Oryzias javanicus TaxID=123683 RepID=A0A3S2UL17_ORYJA|nr:hypothetical protein OJAV_G00049640 [Oryzias javanicus]
MLSDGEAAELLSFLTPGTRPDVKAKATEYILGLSASREGCCFLRSKPDMVGALFALTSDPSVAIAKECYHILINLSADETLHQVLLSAVEVLPVLFKRLLDPDYLFSDQISTILSNLTRHEKTCRTVFKALQEDVGLDKLVEIFCTEGYNVKAKLHYLGPLLSNLTQLPEARNTLMDRDRWSAASMANNLARPSPSASSGRGTPAVGCFRDLSSVRDWSRLTRAVGGLQDRRRTECLFPPASRPVVEKERFRCERWPACLTSLPVDLQYLPEDKKREEDPDIRKMLLEALLLLTATKAGRKALKDKKVYPIMREFHRWEPDVHVAAACEKLIQVLIGEEPEPGMENLMEVQIPDDVEKKLKEMDAREQEELEKEERRRCEEESRERS